MFSWYYIEGILIQSCYTLLIVLGLSILTGYTGMFSFGHAGFVCIGAYVSVICTMAFAHSCRTRRHAARRGTR